MFYTLGTVQNYLKTLSLKQKWRMKQFGMEDDEKNKRANAVAQPNGGDRQKIMEIANKLKAGKRLSSMEMSYLRQYAPDLYNKAVKIAAEREQYRKELEKCKTKEEVDALHASRMAALAGEASNISRSNMSASAKIAAFESLQMRVAGMQDEFHIFTKSAQYQKLRQQEEAEKEKQADKTQTEPEAEEEETEEPSPTDPEIGEQVDWPVSNEGAETSPPEQQQPVAEDVLPSKPAPKPAAPRRKSFSMRI